MLLIFCLFFILLWKWKDLTWPQRIRQIFIISLLIFVFSGMFLLPYLIPQISDREQARVFAFIFLFIWFIGSIGFYFVYLAPKQKPQKRRTWKFWLWKRTYLSDQEFLKLLLYVSIYCIVPVLFFLLYKRLNNLV